MGEAWKPIPGHAGYEASDHGRIRSVDRTVSTARGLQRWPGRVLRPVGAGKGYWTVTLGGQRRAYVAHLVLLAFVGARPDGMQVRHLDGDRTNNRLFNLAYGTPSENEQDKRRHGTYRLRGRTILTEEDVRSIRQSTAPRRALARRYGVSTATILAVQNRTIWRHL